MKFSFSILQKVFFVFLSTASFLACKQDSVEIGFEKVQLDPYFDGNAILMQSDQIFYLLGGDNWNLGVSAFTLDGGATWKLDSIANHELNDVAFIQNEGLITTGKSGYWFEKPLAKDEWIFTRMTYWDELMGIASDSKNEILVAGGGGLTTGVIWRLDMNRNILSRTEWPHEFRAIEYSGGGIYHAAGYGILLRTTDGGKSWEDTGMRGDFYQDIHFPSESTGYVVGSGSSILKTTDRGKNWSKIRGDDIAWSALASYNAVFFIDPLKGYVAGDNGRIEKTTDGGETWEYISNFPEVNLLAISVFKEKVVVAGADGNVFLFSTK